LPANDAQTVSEKDKKKASREAALDKAKRKAKRQEREAERIRTATARSGDDDDDEPAFESQRGKLKGRVVERWTERDYNVPSHEGGTRRVIVTGRDSRSTERSVSISERSSSERGSPLGIFGVIFGGGN
jgi:hypothetical protein